MPDPYVISCSGFCRSVWELEPPNSVLLEGKLSEWMYEEGWSRTADLHWTCPDCTRQEENDDA